jgi:hypothetical protein
MRGLTVSHQARDRWTDECIVSHLHKWAVRQSECGFNAAKANRIADQELFPLQKILESRGPGSLLKLLPLTRDKNANVRLIAAGFAFQAAPSECRRVLEDLIAGRGMVAILAWATLAQMYPDNPPDAKLLLD